MYLQLPVCHTRSRQGLGWDRVCEAQRSNESPSGAFKRQRGLRQQMEGRCPDKNHRLQSVVLFVLLALCGMVWYTQLNKSNFGE